MRHEADCNRIRWTFPALAAMAGAATLALAALELAAIEARPYWGGLCGLLAACTAGLAWPGDDPALVRSRRAMVAHVTIAGLAFLFLPMRVMKPLWPALIALSGLSLFVLTGLVHEAAHGLLARRAWINELLGNLAGWILATPLSAYRAFHLKHHQSTNRADDPNTPLNQRKMLVFGSIVYVGLIHHYAWTHLRGRALARYLLEMAGMTLALAGFFLFVPHAIRERVIAYPLLVVILLQNVRIVSEHLDLPAGRGHDTWQLVLPAWLSRWVLHYDHHLEHHIRPGLHWYQLPAFRAELSARESAESLHRVTLGDFFRDVYLHPAPRPIVTPIPTKKYRYHTAHTASAPKQTPSRVNK